jgi:hypothetical protein
MEEKPQETPSVESSDIESDYAPRSKVEQRLVNEHLSPNEVTSGKVELKVGKAKAKRAKKLARLEEATLAMQEVSETVAIFSDSNDVLTGLNSSNAQRAASPLLLRRSFSIISNWKVMQNLCQKQAEKARTNLTDLRSSLNI